jgi:hypothetical protein
MMFTITCSNTLHAPGGSTLPGKNVNWDCYFPDLDNVQATADTKLIIMPGSRRVVDREMGYIYSLKTYNDCDTDGNLVCKPVTNELLDMLDWQDLEAVEANHVLDDYGWTSTLTIVFGDNHEFSDDLPYVMNLELANKILA